MTQILPVILSGGSGTRLWPLSRPLFPKQLLALAGPRTMLQETVARVAPGPDLAFLPPLIVANHEHRFVIAEQLRTAGIVPHGIVLEPKGRNTAPAIATAALHAADHDPGALLLVLPADHVIREVAAFRAAIARAAVAARDGRLVTFGMAPTRPETGYGYIEAGAPLADGVFTIARFVEKPDRATAERYLAEGRMSWNGGMFLFQPGVMLEELARHAPGVLEGARAALAAARRDLEFLRLDAAGFSGAPAISIDYAVMERTDRAAIVPCDIGWTDVGSWEALWEIGPADGQGNVARGDAVLVDSRGCYVRAESRLVTVVGAEDLVVVETDDAVLVAPRARAQDVKTLVDALRAERRAEAEIHKRVYRPWGFYQGVHDGARFQVKRITVYPGQKLSLQRHYHRAEHWVVVNGTARVHVDGRETLLRENESVFIPLGSVHRLENPGRLPLDLIEVQSGPYLGEDDIERFEDTYGRA